MSLTQKQEDFCQKYIELGDGASAYRSAYPRSLNWKDNSVYVAASKLLTNTKVSLRVQELKEHHAKRHEITVDLLISELEEIRVKAMVLTELPAASTAIMNQARLLGMLVRKIEVHRPASIERLRRGRLERKKQQMNNKG